MSLSRPRRPSRRLCLESLEDRSTPAITMAAVGNNSGEVVVINADTDAKILDFRPFDTATSKYIGQMSIALGDVNGDGQTDLIVATRGTRAGKIKVFDGAGIVAGTVTKPTQTILVAFPVSGYTQGLTVASADVNGDGVDDIVAASRASKGSTGTLLSATVVVYDGANTGAGGILNGATIGSFHPIGTATDGLYVTAGNIGLGGFGGTDGNAEIAVSSANRSLVEIFQLSGGSFIQLGSDFSPFGSTAFVPGNGDGQISALNVITLTPLSSAVFFEVGRLDTSNGTVDLQFLNDLGGNISSYSDGSGVTFFGLDFIALPSVGQEVMMVARVTPSGGTSIDLLDASSGTARTPLNGFLKLTGKVTVAGGRG
jgi:FG-GAP-like repeat